MDQTKEQASVMNANYDEQLLLAYVEGEIDAAGRQQVESWITEDPELAQMLRGMMSDREIMLDVSEEKAPEWILEDITRSMERDMLLDGLPGGTVPVDQEKETQAPVLARIGAPLGAVAATLVIGIIAAGLYFGGLVDFGPSDPMGDKMVHRESMMPHSPSMGVEASETTDKDELHLSSRSLVNEDKHLEREMRQPPASRAVRGHEFTERSTAISRSGLDASPTRVRDETVVNDPELFDEMANAIGNNVITSMNRSNAVLMEMARNELPTQRESNHLQETLFRSRNVASLNVNARSLEEANAMLVAFANDHQLQQFSGKVMYENQQEDLGHVDEEVVNKAVAPRSNRPASVDRMRTEMNKPRTIEGKNQEEGANAQDNETTTNTENDSTHVKRKKGNDRSMVMRQQVVTLVVPEDQAELILTKLNNSLRHEQSGQQMMEQRAVLPKQSSDQPKESSSMDPAVQPGSQTTDDDFGTRSGNYTKSAPDQKSQNGAAESVSKDESDGPEADGETSTPSDALSSKSPKKESLQGKGQTEKEDNAKPASQQPEPESSEYQRQAHRQQQGQQGQEGQQGQQGQQGQSQPQAPVQQQLLVQDWKPDGQAATPDQDRSTPSDLDQWGIPLTRLQNILKHSRVQQQKETPLVTIQVIIQENK